MQRRFSCSDRLTIQLTRALSVRMITIHPIADLIPVSIPQEYDSSPGHWSH